MGSPGRAGVAGEEDFAQLSRGKCPAALPGPAGTPGVLRVAFEPGLSPRATPTG